MKYAIGFVLYNPSKEQMENINILIKNKLFDFVVVYDNSLTSHKDYLESTCNYLFNGNNDGLAVAYNNFIDIGNHYSIDYLCLGDQDSCYAIEEIKKMMDFINVNHAYLKDTAIIGPRSYADVSKRICRSDTTTEALFLINSGSFLNLPLIQKAGLRYDERLFIDGIDYEFGLAIKAKGYKVLIYENSILEQELGYTRKVFGRLYCCHSPFRYYHIAKARKLTAVKYNGRIIGWFTSLIRSIGTMVKVLFFEDEKLKKIVQSLRGQFERV